LNDFGDSVGLQELMVGSQGSIVDSQRPAAGSKELMVGSQGSIVDSEVPAIGFQELMVDSQGLIVDSQELIRAAEVLEIRARLQAEFSISSLSFRRAGNCFMEIV
jgi:hypothetical protein